MRPAARPSRAAAALLAATVLLAGCGTPAPTVDNSQGTEAALAEPPAHGPADSGQPAEGGHQAEPTAADPAFSPSAVAVSFDYLRSPTHASNQLALWVCDERGHLVRTVFVTDFTARRRGYREREDAVPAWVAAAQPEALDGGQIDLVSSATPMDGRLSYAWDLTDDSGARVPDGRYTIVLEATLFWASNVRYEAAVDLGRVESGDLSVTEIRSEPGEMTNDGMIANVTMTVT